MIKIFIFSIFVFCISVSIQSQNNYGIDSTSKWIQEEVLGGTSDWAERNYSLTIQGDTSINDTTFSKMYLNGQSVYWDHGGSSTTILSDLYFGAVYNNLGNIFFVAPDSNNSMHLYDFNYNVNDTIKTIIGNGLTIIDIDTITDGRKKYKTNSVDQLYIVEGIGSNHGFYFAYFLYQLEATVDTTLGCYYQNETLVFLNDTNVCFFSFPVTTYEITKENKPILYPNPADNIIIIKIDEQVEDVTIYDLYGRKFHVDNYQPNQVDISTLPTGCYLININYIHTLKFIKK